MKKIKKYDVLILFEHTVRELDAVCLLKKEFEKRNYSVKIVGVYPNKERIPIEYSADYIFLPWAYKDTEYVQCFLKNSPKAVFINLHWEEYTTISNGDFLLPKGTAKLLYHVSWGNKFTESLNRVGCKTIFTVGSIRLDFYKQNLRKIFLSKNVLADKYGLAKNKQWVLFIADGAHLVESYQTSISQETRMNFPPCKNRTFFIESVEKYLENNLETVFIYRPHPSYANKENKRDDLLKIKTKYPNNFYIISEESIGNWIVNCALSISYQSTSVIDCICANSPFYLLRNTEINPSGDYEFFNNYPYTIHSYEDFVTAINSKEYNNSAVQQLFNDFYVLGNEYSYVNLVTQLLEKKPEKTELQFNLLYWIKNVIRANAKDAIIWLSRNKMLYSLFNSFEDNRLKRIIGPSDDIVSEEKMKQIEDKIKNI